MPHTIVEEKGRASAHAPPIHSFPTMVDQAAPQESPSILTIVSDKNSKSRAHCFSDQLPTLIFQRAGDQSRDSHPAVSRGSSMYLDLASLPTRSESCRVSIR